MDKRFAYESISRINKTKRNGTERRKQTTKTEYRARALNRHVMELKMIFANDNKFNSLNCMRLGA